MSTTTPGAIQLPCNIQNHVGSGCWEDEDRGISRFYGRNVIRETQDMGDRARFHSPIRIVVTLPRSTPADRRTHL